MRKHNNGHILIISDPPAAPGYLPRLRFMCNYLVQQGYVITLLTEQYQPLPFEHSYPVITIPMYSGGTLDWLVKTVWTLLTDWHNRIFAKRAVRLLPIPEADSHPFDGILCTAFSDFPLGAARYLANYYNIPLLCDIRDLDEQVDDSRYQYRHQSYWLMPFRRLYRAIHIRRRNKVLRAADAITTVSPWHADFIRRYNANVHVVYNGYDAEQFYPENIHAEAFRIMYIGSLFEWQQPALQLVRQIITEMHLPITLELHTPQQSPIRYTELGNTIRQSSIMLVLTNPSTHGMLTTKFYEALGCEKPILCVPSDQGSLAELIQYTNAGIATDAKEQIQSFILARYREWQEQGFTRQPVYTDNQNLFSRQHQSQILEQIISHLIHHSA